MRKFRCAKLTLTLIAAAALFVSAGQAMAQAPSPDIYGAPIPDGDYYIIANHQGDNSYMCLDVPNWDTRANIFIQLFPIRNQGNQLWRVQRQPDGFYQITNVYSGKALDVPDASTNSGVPIQQYYPHSGDNQRWRFDLTFGRGGWGWHDPTFVRIVSKNSGLTLDVPGGDYSVHQGIQQYVPNSGWNQTWLLRLR